jgi:CHAT domain-containing protein
MLILSKDNSPWGGFGGDADKLLRGGLASVAVLRRQEPLPETADELCDVGRSLAAPSSDILLGGKATERTVKSLSASGALASYRVLHFATHGLLPQETASVAAGLTEAALLLTPPDTASDDDDGLLTASEVTLLKLNADWVIMSACNTGGGDKSGEALSGLARAFFYAGARALLVSHWYVDSASAIALTTKIFDEMKRDPKLGRAEALKRSMQALIASGGRFSHPANWAPFVVVGEGGAR